MPKQRLGKLSALLAGCTAAAAWLLPDPLVAWHSLGKLLRHSAADHRAASNFALAAGSLIVWSLIVWLGSSVLVLTATKLPGRLGAAARAASQLVVPAALRRLLCGALSLSLAGGTLAGTAQAASLTHPVPRSAVVWQAATDLDWPTIVGQSDRRAQLPNADQTDQPRPAAPKGVVVRPGDCLWRITARSLHTDSPTAIAQEWPKWWERNRDVIGENPHLIRPGEILHPPDTSP
ncbi:MAG TPA: hypothetical protein VHU91_07845 [Mycobacteriales bacterium]|jgi:nucleoid-associated protein YgaU|nr:hypothetical protein [Mycobacteriales bacterium]